MNTAPRTASIVRRALLSCSLAAIVLALVACDVGGDCGLLGGAKRVGGVCVSNTKDESAYGGSRSGAPTGSAEDEGSAEAADRAAGPAWPDLVDAPGDGDADADEDASLDPDRASDSGAVLDGDAPDA